MDFNQSPLLVIWEVTQARSALLLSAVASNGARHRMIGVAQAFVHVFRFRIQS
jgi:hypothetical protein